MAISILALSPPDKFNTKLELVKTMFWGTQSWFTVKWIISCRLVDNFSVIGPYLAGPAGDYQCPGVIETIFACLVTTLRSVPALHAICHYPFGNRRLPNDAGYPFKARLPAGARCPSDCRDVGVILSWDLVWRAESKWGGGANPHENTKIPVHSQQIPG
jgi:hypothetical protein